jgi:hypothetical protein
VKLRGRMSIDDARRQHGRSPSTGTHATDSPVRRAVPGLPRDTGRVMNASVLHFDELDVLALSRPALVSPATGTTATVTRTFAVTGATVDHLQVVAS